MYVYLYIVDWANGILKTATVAKYKKKLVSMETFSFQN